MKAYHVSNVARYGERWSEKGGVCTGTGYHGKACGSHEVQSEEAKNGNSMSLAYMLLY